MPTPMTALAPRLAAVCIRSGNVRTGVDPVPWTPILLASRRRSPRCRNRDRRTRRRSGSRWSSCLGAGVHVSEAVLGPPVLRLSRSRRRPRGVGSGEDCASAHICHVRLVSRDRHPHPRHTTGRQLPPRFAEQRRGAPRPAVVAGTAGTRVCRAGPTNGRTSPHRRPRRLRSSLVAGQRVRVYAGQARQTAVPCRLQRRLCSRGPACIVGVPLDAAWHSAPGCAADGRLLQCGRHRPPAQVSTSSRPTTGSRGGMGLEGSAHAIPPNRPSERSPGTSAARARGKTVASPPVQAPSCGALCSTRSRSRSGERPDGERGGNREDQHCRVRLPAGVRRRPFGLPGLVHAERRSRPRLMTSG